MQPVQHHLCLMVLATGLLVSCGCRHPLEVMTHAAVTTERVPIEVNPMAPFRVESIAPVAVQPLGPVRLEAAEVPVKVDGGTPVDLRAELPPREDKTPLQEMVVRQGGSAKIAIVDVDGVLQNASRSGVLTAGENSVAAFREKLEYIAAQQTSSQPFVGVLLRINSPGGGVTATDIMWRDLKMFKQNTGLPVVACLMDLGTGGAYYLACGCDEIVAHPTTVVGGVGVILNLYNLEDALAQLNIVGVPVKAGEQIDMGSPLRSVPMESRELLQGIAQEFHERFQGVVHAARPEAQLDGPANQAVFDGRVMSAGDAKTAGLIDRLGYVDDAIDRVMKRSESSQATVVALHRPQDQANTIYDVTVPPTSLANIFPSIPGVDRSTLPTFLYMWQPEPTMAGD